MHINAQTVARLRNLKHREAKPFALIAADLATVRQLCSVDEAEAALLAVATTTDRTAQTATGLRGSAGYHADDAARTRHPGLHVAVYAAASSAARCVRASVQR